MHDQLPDDRLDGRFGGVTAEADDLPPLTRPDGRPVVGVKYVWRPSPAVAAHLPADFQFAMRRVVLPDGLRRFYPGGFESQIALGFAGGLAILARAFDLTAHRRHSYRAMYQLFRRLRQTREHLGNLLLNETSLYVSRVARDVADERSILPEGLGLDARGQGESWSVRRLLREGREAAGDAGVARPTEADCVHYGFVAAARRNPLPIGDDESRALVRMALYASISLDDPLAPEFVDVVVERTLAAMHEHLPEPAAEFDAWFMGPKNSFVPQIANRKLLPGGVLGRDPVRRALLELGWQSYGHVADCLQAMMRLFRRLLPEPLTREEAAAFEEMHLRRPYLGDLPLVLLVERFPFLQAVLWEIWRRPGDRGLIAVLHRLLWYYAETALARRSTDRVVKSRRPGNTQAGERTPLTVPLPTAAPADPDADELPDVEEDDRGGGGDDRGDDEDVAARPSARTAGGKEVFTALAERIRERRRIRCGCVSPHWDDKVVHQDETEVTISHTCECGFTAESTTTLAELRDMPKEL